MSERARIGSLRWTQVSPLIPRFSLSQTVGTMSYRRVPKIICLLPFVQIPHKIAADIRPEVAEQEVSYLRTHAEFVRVDCTADGTKQLEF